MKLLIILCLSLIVTFVVGMNKYKPPPYQRKRSFINLGQTMSNQTVINDLPKGTTILDNQVAGHTFREGTNEIGMLKDQHDGSILKPATKPICGSREITFYEQLETQDYKIPKELIAEFRGTIKMSIGDRSVEFIKLSDIAHGMLEPCIMDIKIGKRTWDPWSSPEKRAAEDLKYQESKTKLGLSLPGFQVYDIQSGRLKKYGKEYGKKLNEKTFKDAIRIYLNVESGFCRPLLMQFLSALWNCQKWARSQKHIRLYSSSLLFAYDARRLKSWIESSKKSSSSLSSLNGPLTPISQKTPPTAECNGKTVFSFPVPSSEPIQSYKKVQRSHSAQNNYDVDLKAIRENYAFMLDSLIGSFDNKNEWAFVKMIDFAHIFPAEEDTIDSNYLFGVESLVKIFEEILTECD